MADNSKVYPLLPFESPHQSYLPGVAQQAQNAIYIDPNLNPQPYFTEHQFNMANWFSTRVHLSPLGKA